MSMSRQMKNVAESTLQCFSVRLYIKISGAYVALDMMAGNSAVMV